MLRLLLGVAYRLAHTGYNSKLFLLLLSVFLLGYLIKTWKEVGKQ